MRTKPHVILRKADQGAIILRPSQSKIFPDVAAAEQHMATWTVKPIIERDTLLMGNEGADICLGQRTRRPRQEVARTSRLRSDHCRPSGQVIESAVRTQI